MGTDVLNLHIKTHFKIEGGKIISVEMFFTTSITHKIFIINILIQDSFLNHWVSVNMV